ncbi:hypothetical protein ANANG_G00288540 [Anguilla anguilla]|uniref:Uncharacterized protein n=1 Tax=Anguilla anguilla TaxID=7936 RepID=A0A9D3RLK6_ANGAN|nr:hypothetical protein ANANG_G00288540 [Anguilla anguilla]
MQRKELGDVKTWVPFKKVRPRLITFQFYLFISGVHLFIGLVTDRNVTAGAWSVLAGERVRSLRFHSDSLFPAEGLSGRL